MVSAAPASFSRSGTSLVTIASSDSSSAIECARRNAAPSARPGASAAVSTGGSISRTSRWPNARPSPVSAPRPSTSGW